MEILVKNKDFAGIAGYSNLYVLQYFHYLSLILN